MNARPPPIVRARGASLAGGPKARPPRGGGTPHALYLAAIAALVLVAAYAVGTAVRARGELGRVRRHFGGGGRVSFPRGGALREATPAELLRPRTFDEYRREVDALVARAGALGEFGAQRRLAEACAHALGGGKRLRPIIVMEIARATTLRARAEGGGGALLGPVDPADSALFIEYLHTASLVVDDLPAFDDDAERRGKPAVHAATSPAVAQMAALSLVSAAYQDVCRQIDWIRENCPGFRDVDRVGTRILSEVSASLGAMGAAGGQFMDSALEAGELFAGEDEEPVLRIMELKTATFFQVAFVTGWLVAGGAPAEAAGLREAGRHFGVAFQIADDIGDMAQDAARRAAGKPGWNYANYHGRDAAQAAVTRHLRACRRALAGRGLFTPLWEEIYEKVWGMTG